MNKQRGGPVTAATLLTLPNLLGPLTGPITGDDYVRLLVQRQEAWIAAQPHNGPQMLGMPLLEWFIQPGDAAHVVLPEPVRHCPRPARTPQPRAYRSAASLREERDKVLMEMNRLADPGAYDPAVVNLSTQSRHKAARTAGRRRFARMDSDLERFAALRKRLAVLDGRITRADAREQATR